MLRLVQLSDLPDVDYLVITQSLDDHCHLKTLRPLSEMKPDLRVVATPNAKSLLDPLFRNVSIVCISWARFSEYFGNLKQIFSSIPM